jgi:hypothetical protein
VSDAEMHAEIDQLRRQIEIFVDMAADWVKVGHEKERLQEENDDLRAAIERVRALHRSWIKGAVCDGCAYYYPCPTLRALDGEDGA